TGPMLQFDDGTVWVSHLMNPANEVNWDAAKRTLTVKGPLCRRRAPLMSPVKQIVFRLLALTIGRCNPNWLRLLIQKLFITGKAAEVKPTEFCPQITQITRKLFNRG